MASIHESGSQNVIPNLGDFLFARKPGDSIYKSINIHYNLFFVCAELRVVIANDIIV